MKVCRRLCVVFACAISMGGFSVPAWAAEEITPPAEKTDGGEKPDTREKNDKPLGTRSGRAQSPRNVRTAAKKPVKPTTRKAAAKGTKIPAAANVIVQELRREFELGKLRKKSDYLTEKPNAEMTTDVIMVMLQRRLGTNGPMDGYIKWQLLSGLPSEMPEQSVPDAIAAYMEAPQPEPRPGMTDGDKRELDREIKRSDDPAELTSRLVDEGRRVDILNEPVISYRDRLFAILPPSVDTFRAALKDLYDRGAAGITPRSQSGRLADRITKWAPDADPADAEAVLGMLDELLAVQMPEYYDTPRFVEADNRYAWSAHRANLNDSKRLDDAAEALEDRLGSKPADDQAPARPAKPNRAKSQKNSN